MSNVISTEICIVLYLNIFNDEATIYLFVTNILQLKLKPIKMCFMIFNIKLRVVL